MPADTRMILQTYIRTVEHKHAQFKRHTEPVELSDAINVQINQG